MTTASIDFDYETYYKIFWDGLNFEGQKRLSQIVMSLFREQNAGEEEHADTDMAISRMCVLELMFNKSEEEDDKEYLCTIEQNPAASIQIGMELAKQRIMENN